MENSIAYRHTDTATEELLCQKWAGLAEVNMWTVFGGSEWKQSPQSCTLLTLELSHMTFLPYYVHWMCIKNYFLTSKFRHTVYSKRGSLSKYGGLCGNDSQNTEGHFERYGRKSARPSRQRQTCHADPISPCLFHTRSHTDIPITHFALMLKHAGYPRAIQNFPFSFFYPARLYILTLLYELHVSGDCSQEGHVLASSLTAFFIAPI